MQNSYKVVCSDELAHHGINGQRWGHRNGPPYPLDYEAHSRKEKAANSKSEIDGTSKTIKSQSTTNTSKPNKSKEKHRLNLTEQQKKYIKNGAIVVGSVLAVSGGVIIAKKMGVKIPNINSLGGKLDINSGLKLSNKIGSINEEASKVNPFYSMFSTNKNFLATNMNCGNCATAFELRMRGIDAKALGNEQGMSIASMGRYFKGLKSESFIQFSPNVKPVDIDTLWGIPLNEQRAYYIDRGKTIKGEIAKGIAKQYSGDARGMLFVPMENSSHWVSWVKTGNKIEFVNSQNTAIDLTEVFGHYDYKPNSFIAELTSIRLDDLSINKDTIKEVVTDSNAFKLGTHDTFKSFGDNFVTSFLDLQSKPKPYGLATMQTNNTPHSYISDSDLQNIKKALKL